MKENNNSETLFRGKHTCITTGMFRVRVEIGVKPYTINENQSKAV